MVGPVREPAFLPPVTSAAAVLGPAAAASPGPAPAVDGASVFAGLLRGLGQEASRGEALMRSALGAARAAQPVGPAELIALQAGVYRYGETVDLASRLIDRATSAVKTVLQGQ
jgi:hypothetical protein